MFVKFGICQLWIYHTSVVNRLTLKSRIYTQVIRIKEIIIQLSESCSVNKILQPQQRLSKFGQLLKEGPSFICMAVATSGMLKAQV